MSRLFGAEPDNCQKDQPWMELIIIPRTVDIGGFKVHRALPSKEKRMVGPFIFWDQMGPGKFDAGEGVDVRPHPHIGLSTITYLFDGNMDHKDSLANDIRIVPGDINFMTAGKGIVHSERTGLDIRRGSSRLHGIQSWLAQPKQFEGSDPEFKHLTAAEIPTFETNEIFGRLILGTFQNYHSPIETQCETIYLELKIKKGASIEIPRTIEERALYLISGTLDVGGTVHKQRQLLVLYPASEIIVTALEDVHMMLIGGSVMDGVRYIWWNFVSSSVDRIKNAAEDWKNGRFEEVPGDNKEFIPLPDLPFPED